MLPIKTTFLDVAAVTNYLKQQVGWVEIDRIKKTIPPTHADNRKLEAMRYMGLIERDGSNIKLSSSGRRYATEQDDGAKAAILRGQISIMPLYQQTLEWIHYSKKENPGKTEVANYWHDEHSSDLQGASGSALTDAVIFFFRFVDQTGIGHFVPAGVGRAESYLKVDSEALSNWVTGVASTAGGAGEGTASAQIPKDGDRNSARDEKAGAGTDRKATQVNPAVQVNIEIHIAADAKPSTVEEIFKNMRKYVLNASDDESTS